MNITVRLYKLHDYDLIFLYKNLRFPVKDAMKKALENFVRNEHFFFDYPIANVHSDSLRNLTNAQFHIKLNEDEDEDIILFLEGLKRNYRNSFLKNLLRGYMAGPIAYVYQEMVNVEDETKRKNSIENNIMNIKTLDLMKFKNKKKYLKLTEDQKELFDQLGILDGIPVKIITKGEDND